MTLIEAIHTRHSVRKYINRPLNEDVIITLQEKIAEINAEADLHIQLVLNEPKSFKGINSYGMLTGVQNYFVVAGKKILNEGSSCPIADLEQRAGYYGEQLVLFAQQLGLNTCWVGLAYKKIPGTFSLEKGEKVVCYIALGYGETHGVSHKIKSVSDVSNAGNLTPKWFYAGVEAALLAPTAVNQQKFYIEYVASNGVNGKCKVGIRPLFSLVGYTKIDLGIVKYHFEVGAGVENFVWVKQ